ncbi:MAG TPA: phosphatase PAP2 family protein [Intrasporangium sp.]|uniref:phosphatase PAP2 family protein n=1 Tax=Intrasporangium sp. TaxID=1925024 RepID=UPI002D77A5AF|nr:phosphatase PAP2 family protein [Intrasporangium sp.]HET7397017.1 phosphatase PAP2 family protein [Intrasporangium sp.]
MTTVRRLDDAVFFAVNRFAESTPWLHGPVLGYAAYGMVLFAGLLLAALLISRTGPSTRLAATGWAAVATLGALGVNQVVGRVFAESRPYAAHPGILRLADATTDFSFPSDHAVMAGAVAAGLLLAHRRLGRLAVGAAGLMAFARVYIGAHYPWDVLAGLVLGAAVSVAGWLLLRRPLTALTSWLRRLPVLRTAFPPPGGETGGGGLHSGDAVAASLPARS